MTLAPFGSDPGYRWLGFDDSSRLFPCITQHLYQAFHQLPSMTLDLTGLWQAEASWHISCMTIFISDLGVQLMFWMTLAPASCDSDLQQVAVVMTLFTYSNAWDLLQSMPVFCCHFSLALTQGSGLHQASCLVRWQSVHTVWLWSTARSCSVIEQWPWCLNHLFHAPTHLTVASSRHSVSTHDSDLLQQCFYTLYMVSHMTLASSRHSVYTHHYMLWRMTLVFSRHSNSTHHYMLSRMTGLQQAWCFNTPLHALTHDSGLQ